MEEAPAAVAAAPAAAAPAAVLNSVQAVAHTQQPASYVFNPERYSEISGDYWQVLTVTPVQTKQLWQATGADKAGHNSTSVDSTNRAIGHFVFAEGSAVWRRKSPTTHAALRVKVELDRQSYMNRTRTKEMGQPIQAWSFLDSGAQVCMINPKMVAAMNGAGLVAAASLQIKDAGGHILPVDGAIFIVITRKDKKTGLSKRTHKIAYVCQKTED